MYSNGRFFPSDYYQVCTSNPSKRERWFCNRPPTPERQSSSSQDDSLARNDSEILQSTRVSSSEEEIVTEPSSCGNIDANSVLANASEDENIDDSDNDPDYEPNSDESSEDSISVPVKKRGSNERKDVGIDNGGEDPAPSVSNIVQETGDREKMNGSLDNGRENAMPPISGGVLDSGGLTVPPDYGDLGKLTVGGELRKGKKGKDFCYYCEELVLNFARHLVRNHSNEADVQRICLLEPGSKERQVSLAALRKKGNFLNSNTVKKPMHHPALPGKELLPCTNCMGFYSSKLLWRHRKKCCENNDKVHKVSGQNMLLRNALADPQLVSEVFPRMRPDNVSLTAKKDPLICAYGARYIKTHREKHFAVVASRKMRELAKLLIELKKCAPEITSLLDAFKPQYFDLLVAATKTIAKYNYEKDYFESPTLALNMGTTLKQCCDLAIVFALKRKHVFGTIPAAEVEAEIRSTIHLIATSWKYEISSKAANDLHVQAWNKVTIVPLASDLKILKEYLIKSANTAASTLQEDNHNKDAYMTLLETIFCRTILLNRRRPGELQRLPLCLYESNADGEGTEKYEEFLQAVTPSEKILMQSLKRVVIRGKRGRGVPVLFSVDVQEHINVILKYRVNFYSGPNPYLFGKPNSSETVCGYKTLRKYAVASAI
ncbi:unnamed protein product [Callosobruchus maculatus]|uniref:Uncharacterized protein n=1 Tax=Callosobruchus maculatus TaxID=64391 RepID=A0A653DHE0_CALMS|nr:unnamed protein product [Callosobruchus maculatus]